MEQAKYDVFISYSRKDYVDEKNNVIPNNVVSQIKELLKKSNLSYWFDEEGIYSGDEFAPMLARAIKNSKIFLFVSTENSNSSDWTSNEIATAHAFKKKIIPFRVDSSVYNDSVILYIAKLDYIDYNANPAKALIRLLKSINEYLLEYHKNNQDSNGHELDQKAREKELNRLRERISKVSKEMDDLRNQWQVSSTLYDDLKAREAEMLNVPYERKKIGLDDEVKQDRSGLSSNSKISVFKRLINWLKSPDGRVRHPWSSITLKSLLIIAVLSSICLYICFFAFPEPLQSRMVFLKSSCKLSFLCIIFFYAIKWKRVMAYIFFIIIFIAAFDILVHHSDQPFSHCTWLLLSVIMLTLLTVPRYQEMGYFEQSDSVYKTIGSKSAWRSFGKMMLIFFIPYFFAYLYVFEKREPNINEESQYGYDVADTLAAEDTMLVDTVVAE